MKLSLVVPCYNEEKNIPLFYNAVRQDFAESGIDYELVFVNDGAATALLRSCRSSARATCR